MTNNWKAFEGSNGLWYVTCEDSQGFHWRGPDSNGNMIEEAARAEAEYRNSITHLSDDEQMDLMDARR